jgi:Zn-dependent protease
LTWHDHYGFDLHFSTWLLPLLIAIIFTKRLTDLLLASVAMRRLRLGRVSLNPVRHIDPFGTIVLPALLLLARSPFLFGYAKPVPVKKGNQDKSNKVVLLPFKIVAYK